MLGEFIQKNNRPGSDLHRIDWETERDHVRVFAKTDRRNRNSTTYSQVGDCLCDWVSFSMYNILAVVWLPWP